MRACVYLSCPLHVALGAVGARDTLLKLNFLILTGGRTFLSIVRVWDMAIAHAHALTAQPAKAVPETAHIGARPGTCGVGIGARQAQCAHLPFPVPPGRGVLERRERGGRRRGVESLSRHRSCVADRTLSSLKRQGAFGMKLGEYQCTIL